LASLEKLNLVVDSNPYNLERHGRGESHHTSMAPQIIVSPRNRAEIKQTMRLCSEHTIPVIPFGAGTSLEGHVSAVAGGVSLSFTEHYNKILSISELSMSAVVQAGVTRHQLNSELRATGLHFVVDPGADASLGGMAATGASGTSAVRYGTMRTNTLGLTVISPSGEVVTCGSDTVKSSAGYDLTRLYVGSEGTLGVIDTVTVRLHPIPQVVSSATVAFDDITQAADAVCAMLMSSIPLAKCELLDTSTIKAFNSYTKNVQDMPEKPTLFLEFHATSDVALSDQISQARDICEETGSGFEFAKDEKERKDLWAARHQTYYAAVAMRPEASGVVTDACVPLEHLPTVLTETVEDLARSEIIGATFGHAGDGNFHCILPVCPTDSEEYGRKIADFSSRLVHRTLVVGGTCSGEHGIGTGKMGYLKQMYDRESIDVMRAIKKALDPKNIMNPHKIFEWDEADEDGKEQDPPQYLHVAPCGDAWVAPGIFAAKHLQADYVRSFGPVSASFDAEELSDDERKALYDRGCEEVTPLR
jgi:D-lactate dehydrogenase (cytochrome)